MKAALIPPKGYYETASRSNYHLVLAQIEDYDYKRVYSSLSSKHFIILDNGAAEGPPVRDSVLLEKMAFYGADEIVIPDVMQDARKTLERAETFFAKHVLPTEVQTMIVIQGDDEESVRWCLYAAMEKWPKATIGLPRHLLETLDDVYARANLIELIGQMYPNTKPQVHLLGTSYLWPAEVQYIADLHDWVRGVDTSMPYCYTIENKRLDSSSGGVERPPGYFDHPWSINTFLMDRNIRTYLEWASGTEGTRS